MKLPLQPQPERGFFATIIMVAIVALLLVFVMANGRRLYQLDRELNRVEQQQTQKFRGPHATTNPVATPHFTNPPATGTRRESH